MAQHKLLYIEHKAGFGSCGPAWIGHARLSKSGRTIYFNNKALKMNKSGICGNHYCIETGDEYWVSGLKERGTNRHWAGGGIIQIDQKALGEFLNVRGTKTLNTKYYEVVSIPDTDISRFHHLENA